MTCTWVSSRADESWPCTGDHSAGVHHFAGTDRTLPLAVTDIAARDRLERPSRPSGAGLDIEDVLAAHGLGRKAGEETPGA